MKRAIAAAIWMALALGGCQQEPAAPGATAAGAGENAFAELGQGIDDVTLTLVSAGEATRWGALNGKPRAVFFGFTHCPMICPVTIWELSHAMQQLGVAPDAVALDFVTVDPERDTPARLREYLASFDGPVRGLYADGETLAAITQSFDVVARRTPTDDGAYTIDHTATVFLLDSSGRVVDGIVYGSPPELIQERLRALLGLPPPAPDGG